MDCNEAQESILEALLDPLAAEQRLAMENHVAACEACAGFAGTQRTLDARFTAAVPSTQLSPAFRAALRKKMRRDPLMAWPDFLPDLAHIVGCGIAVAVSVMVLPLRTDAVLLAGTALTGATYLLQSALRMSLEEGE
jgi:predicted anti-sigma-YlaC factor YlaD